MSLFSGPEYASYRQLCRKLRLERKPFEYGDVWCFWKDVASGPFVQGAAGNDGADEFAVWLPRLDQWLAKLQEDTGRCDFAVVGFNELIGPCAVRWRYRAEWNWWEAGEDRYAEAVGDAPEEACARLWCAVTGREVPT